MTLPRFEGDFGGKTSYILGPGEAGPNASTLLDPRGISIEPLPEHPRDLQNFSTILPNSAMDTIHSRVVQLKSRSIERKDGQRIITHAQGALAIYYAHCQAEEAPREDGQHFYPLSLTRPP